MGKGKQKPAADVHARAIFPGRVGRRMHLRRVVGLIAPKRADVAFGPMDVGVDRTKPHRAEGKKHIQTRAARRRFGPNAMAPCRLVFTVPFFFVGHFLPAWLLLSSSCAAAANIPNAH